MLYETPLENILFLDIETVPATYRYEDLAPEWQQLFADKTAYQQKDGQTAEDIYEKAGIWAEFGKVVAVAFGLFRRQGGQRRFVLRVFADEDERKLLEQVAEVLRNFDRQVRKSRPGAMPYLCAHNGKEFDFPFLARRMLVQGVPLPDLLKMQGKKPWEVPFCDTLQLWRFGDFKHYVSLELLARLFDLPTPKSDISGKDVARVYYEEKDLERIARYCQNDVLTLANVFLRMRQEPPLAEEEVVRKE